MRHHPDWFYHFAKVPALGAMAAICYYFWPTYSFGPFDMFERAAAVFLWSILGAIIAGFLTQCILEGIHNTWMDAVEKKQRPDFWIAIFTGITAVAAILTILSQKHPT